jgi:tetratricopeptide (TPR) repeat protein
LLVDTLNRRGDPVSRKRMVALLRRIQKDRPLQPQYELLLGQALFDVGQWADCERQMQDAITRYPNDVALRVGLIEMLINRKDAAGAERWLSRLANIKDGGPAIPQLRIRLTAVKGDKDELRKQLVAITPNLNVLDAKQLQVVHSIALLADSVGDHEYALKLITEFARRTPGNDGYELAQFTAMYGDVDAGLNMLQQLFPGHMDQVLSSAIEVLRARRKEDPAKIDAIIDSMVRRALNADPEAARRMVQKAEALEIEERYPEAIVAYTKLLDRDDVPKFVRATAFNNRSFLLAITKQDLDLALQGVNEAMKIIGPVSDVLDTRGLVYLHRGEFKPAVEDLKLAVTMNATASKYFHLAEALLGAGDQKAALEAWKEAQARGIAADKVPTVELPDFEETMKKFEALGAPVPKA